MEYKYKHLITQNIAPIGAKSIGVYDSGGNRVCVIPLGKMTPPVRQKLYSFGLVSDIHLWEIEPSWNANTKFDKALSYFENQECVFCCVSGDLTQTGLYKRTVESDASTTYFDASQLAKYKEICDKHTIPVYEITGNHESYYSMSITNNLDKWETYTGKNVLAYTVSQGDELFIFVGQPKVTIPPISDEDLQWLYETLETNRNKRCFIFVHSHISSGNPLGAYTSNNYFAGWGTKTTVFKNLLSHYNVILFSGHSHFIFECQEYDKTANYSDDDGFKSIHIPSLSRPCDIIDGVRTTQDSKSQGYLVDVYDDYIILNGRDFVNDEWSPLGTYKIDTPLVTVEANTFIDNTGTIITNVA